MLSHEEVRAPQGGDVPTSHRLSAALRVAEHLQSDPTPLEQVRNSYPHIPSDGWFSPSDLRDGEDLLVSAGWAVRDDHHIHLDMREFRVGEAVQLQAKRLLKSYLTRRPPSWLEVAFRDDELDPELVPPEEQEALAATLTDPDEREALLFTLARQFDDSYRKQLGTAGEMAVVKRCQEILRDRGRPDLAEQVLHVSLISDALGYDVKSPTIRGGVLRLEVKTTSQGDRRDCRVFLSRNEADVALRDETWRLVICSGRPGSDIDIVGWCEGRSVVSLLPKDSDKGQWVNAEVTLDVELLKEGLPLDQDEP